MSSGSVFDEKFELEDSDVITVEADSENTEGVAESVYESDDNPDWVDDSNSDVSDDDKNGVEEASDVDDVELRISNSDKSQRMTREEYNLLQEDIRSKEKELAELNIRVAEAREAGDLSENTAFQDLSEKARGLAGDISKLKGRVKTAQIVSTEEAFDRIGIGSMVNIIITDEKNRMPAEVVDVKVVSEGFGGIDDNGNVLMPENSEVYRKMRNSVNGEFILTGTDGINYHYVYKMIAG